MAIRNAIEAVIKTLQRQQSEAAGDAPPRAEPITEVMLGNSVGSENPSQLTGTKDSLVKARYALRVLRVAQTSDQETAARLVRGVAHDFPDPNELPEIADIHLRAIESFFQLAASLSDATNSKQHPWNTAVGAAEDWLRVVDAQQ